MSVLSALYRVISKGLSGAKAPLASDVNQFVDLLNGLLDAGVLTLAPQISVLSTTGISAAAGSGTTLGIGPYIYKLTYVTGNLQADNSYTIAGETPGSASISVTTTAGNQNPTLSGLPAVGTWPATAIGIRIYRTAVGGADGTQKLVTTLITNYARTTSQTTYTDTTADGALGATVPTTNTTGTTLQNYVDQSTAQSIGGAKTFTSHPTVANTESSDSAFGILNYNAALGANITNKNIGGVQWLINGVSKFANIMYANTDGGGNITYNRALWYAYQLATTIFSMDLITGGIFTKNNTLDNGTTGDTQFKGNIVSTNGSSHSLGANVAGNVGLEIGSTATATATTPFIDFHSGATAVDYDARIIASGGNGVAGGGALNFEAAALQMNGTTMAQTRTTNGYVEWNKGGVWKPVAGYGSAKAPGSANTTSTTAVTVLSVSGMGRLNMLAIAGSTSANQTYTVVVDGTTILSGTVSASGTKDYVAADGSISTSPQYANISFESSLSITLLTTNATYSATAYWQYELV